MKNLFLFSLLVSFCNFGQKISSENLGPKVKVYWDANNKKLHSTGSYYIDKFHPETTEKHGKWMFYSLDGKLEEERYYFRDRVHGKQTTFFPNKKVKQVYYSVFNVSDSVYKEYNESGTLIITGNYEMGSPIGKWHYYYPDSTLWKQEFVSGDTTYLVEYRNNDSVHTPMVVKGNGKVITYFTNGGIKESYEFKKGLRHGVFFENLATGILSISGEFKLGKKHGEWIFNFNDGTMEKKQHFIEDSLDGSYLVNYPNGTTKTEGTYRNGKKQGSWVWKMENGKVEMEGAFKNDLQDGDWNYYFSSGELSYRAHFLRGLKSGQWEYFYKDGQNFRKGNYENDLKEGLWQTWYEDGTTLMEGKYHLGKEVGEWKNYWPNGRVKNHSFYSNGKLNGAWYSFSPEGKLLLFGRYKNNQKNGKWTEFYNNGLKKEEITYSIKRLKDKSDDVVAMGFKEQRSVQHGKYKGYSQVDYKIKETGRFKYGKKSGKWTNFHPGGVVPAVMANYRKGELHGVFCQNDRRGNKMNEIHYKKGLKDGWFMVFDKNGKAVVKKMFRNGHELRRINAEDMFTP
jgi:antitoxin component YwqK of YwqJK toxin-antitoxin module